MISNIKPETPFSDLPEFLTVDEMRQYLRLGRAGSYELAQKIGALRIGRLIRVPKSELIKIMGQVR